MNNNMLRCPNNHIYDGSRFQFCPYCAQSANSNLTTPVTKPNTGYVIGDDTPTMPLTNSPIPGPTVAANVPSAVQPTDEGKTVSLSSFGKGKVEPVVGWLVCIDGPSYGKSYPIRANRNFIGRSMTMDIALEDDKSVSRERHAIITYVPKQRVFIVQPGESRELFYLNDNVVLNNEEINAYDTLMIGSTKLLFVPLCGEDFSWEDVI